MGFHNSLINPGVYRTPPTGAHRPVQPFSTEVPQENKALIKNDQSGHFLNCLKAEQSYAIIDVQEKQVQGTQDAYSIRAFSLRIPEDKTGNTQVTQD